MRGLRPLLAAVLVGLPLMLPSLARAGTPQQLVDSATLAVENMMGGGEGSQAEQFLRRAKAVVICPNVFRAGFFLGGEGGSCVLVARAANGSWSDPAFYNMGGGSFGFQIGIQNAQVMMMVMTQGGLRALLNSQFKFGADAGLTVATLGAGVGGAMSTATDADIITFAKSQGLYGGVSLAGSVIDNDSDSDRAYYGTGLGPEQIVVDMQGNNAGANPLRAMLSRYGG